MTKQKQLYTGIAVTVAVIAAGYLFVTTFLTAQTPSMPQDQNQPQNAAAESTSTLATSGLPTPPPDHVLVQDVTMGTGAEAVKGAQVSVEYVGKLQNGTTFDESSAHGGSFAFQLGAGQVIQGWEQGILGMKVGGERILIIPSALAYGNQQVGNLIPANSTLIFDVKLVGVGSTTPVKK